METYIYANKYEQINHNQRNERSLPAAPNPINDRFEVRQEWSPARQDMEFEIFQCWVQQCQEDGIQPPWNVEGNRLLWIPGGVCLCAGLSQKRSVTLQFVACWMGFQLGEMMVNNDILGIYPMFRHPNNVDEMCLSIVPVPTYHR
jgi:hypothetical protein